MSRLDGHLAGTCSVSAPALQLGPGDSQSSKGNPNARFTVPRQQHVQGLIVAASDTGWAPMLISQMAPVPLGDPRGLTFNGGAGSLCR